MERPTFDIPPRARAVARRKHQKSRKRQEEVGHRIFKDVNKFTYTKKKNINHVPPSRRRPERALERSAVHRKAPQGPPRYEVALHGSKMFSPRLKYTSKFTKFLNTFCRSEKVLKVSPQKNTKMFWKAQKGDETLSKVLEDYPRFDALLVRF